MKHMGRILCFAGALCACSGGGEAEEVDSRSSLSVRDTDAILPIYARIEAANVYHDDSLAVVSFYRPLVCIPADFNLLDCMDVPRSLGCVPETFEATALFHQPTDFVPYQMTISGLGAVPVWFVSWTEMQAAVADGVLTIGELEALPSRVPATATKFHETLHPLGGANVGFLSIQASGVLDDGGGTFHYSIMQSDGAGRQMTVNIKIDE